jgi:signal transduction histidine kinase
MLNELQLQNDALRRSLAAITDAHALEVTERNRVETALTQAIAQLKMLSKRVLQVQEAERRRIAIDLHDELGQSLTAIKIRLQMHGRDDSVTADDLIAQTIHGVDSTLLHVRQLAQALRPAVLDDLGLTAALRWLVRQAEQRGDFELTFKAVVAASRFDPEVETAYFRVAQEALTNVARHARATQVNVDLVHECDELVMRIADDGAGFEVASMRARAASGESLGVLGMRERATLVGGRLEMLSSPGKGCTVWLSCPWHAVGGVA